ncbi:hypothetical protein JOM56_003342 [Amanita muscaria]
MSDSGDDLGGFDPETPRPPPKRKTKPRANARNNAEPGPSSKPLAKKKPANARLKQSNEESDEVQEVLRDIELEEDVETINVGEEDVQMVDVPNSKKMVSVVNGKTTTKGKGKARVPPSRLTKKAPADPGVIDANAEEESDDPMIEAAQSVARNVAIAFGIGKKEKASREVAKLQERLRESQEHAQTLVAKLEETLRKETESEKLLKAKVEQYKAELKAKDAVVETLTSQLAQKETLALRGKQSILHMITREAADEEQRTLETNIMQLKELLAQQEGELKSKDKQMTGLHQLEMELRMELKAEIERSKTLADKSLRTPQATIRNRPGGAFEDPKNAQVIRFYEDLTNVLVTSMKHGSGPEDEWILKCVYTFSDDGLADETQKSVTFTLRMPSPSESESKNQSIYYVPEELDKEPPDFVEKLEFLNQPFTFSRKQLSIFSRTLYDRLKEACGVDDQQEDDEVQILE